MAGCCKPLRSKATYQERAIGDRVDQTLGGRFASRRSIDQHTELEKAFSGRLCGTRLSEYGVVWKAGLPVRDLLLEQAVRVPDQAGKKEGSSPIVCVVCPRMGARTETFIQSHIQRLPMTIRVLVGSPPHTDPIWGYLYEKNFARRMAEKTLSWAIPFEEQTYRRQALARYFRGARIGLVLAEYGITGVEVMHGCRLAGVPLIVHFHGRDAFHEGVLEEYRTRYAALFQFAAGVVAVSREMRQQLIELGAPAEKVHHIPYWVDCRQFTGAEPANAPPQLLAVGRFVEKKAPYLTVLAFARARQRIPELRLTMIGEGPLLGTCRHLAQLYGVADAVEFTGARDHRFVQHRMAGARAFVQHSVRACDGDCEGTPVAILEAQASGLPVIATRHMGIRDVVLEGQTGLLVDEQDVQAMADAMVRVAREPAVAARWGQAGRRRVLTEFSETQTLGRLAQLIREQAKTSRRPGASVLGGRRSRTRGNGT